MAAAIGTVYPLSRAKRAPLLRAGKSIDATLSVLYFKLAHQTVFGGFPLDLWAQFRGGLELKTGEALARVYLYAPAAWHGAS